MTSHSPRLFADDDAVRRIGEGLLACTLTRSEWTHEAHLAACVYLMTERPDVVPEGDLPAIIRRFNESVGGVNDESQGYHETLTQLYIGGVRSFVARMDAALPLVEKVNRLLKPPKAGATGRSASTRPSASSRSKRGSAGSSRT